MVLKQLLYVLILFSAFLLLVSCQQRRPDNNSTLKCYQCNSFYDKGCADFFDNRTYPLIPCKDNVTMCRKIIQETFYEDHWDVRYIRQCAIQGEVGPAEGRWCKERSGGYWTRLKICQCNNKDGCNTASNFNIFKTFFCITICLSLIFELHKLICSK